MTFSAHDLNDAIEGLPLVGKDAGNLLAPAAAVMMAPAAIAVTGWVAFWGLQWAGFNLLQSMLSSARVAPGEAGDAAAAAPARPKLTLVETSAATAPEPIAPKAAPIDAASAPKAAAPEPVVAPKAAAPEPVVAPIADPVAVPAPAPTPLKIEAKASSKGISLPRVAFQEGKAAPEAGAPSAADKPKGLVAARDGLADDLKLISGIGPKIEQILNGLGVYHFDQVSAWSAREIAWVDSFLKFNGRILRDNWIAQADALAVGGAAEYVRRFGKDPR